MAEVPAARLGADAARWLRGIGSVETQPGLTEEELAGAERAFGFEFPDDLRTFLASALPVRDRELEDDPYRATVFGFPDWRNGDPEHLRAQVEFPVTGVWHEIERGHWPRAWGQRPSPADRALRTARRRLADVPRLVPVYTHRYLPSGRGTWGHPVLSVQGTDIVCYGADLADYVRREFALDEWEAAHPPGSHEFPAATVSFWKDYV